MGVEPPWSCVDDSTALHVSQRKGSWLFKSHSHSMVPCCLVSPFHGDITLTHSESNISPSSEADGHGHALFGRAGSKPLFSMKILINKTGIFRAMNLMWSISVY